MRASSLDLGTLARRACRHDSERIGGGPSSVRPDMHRGLALGAAKMTISCPSASAARNTCRCRSPRAARPGGTAPGFPHLQFHRDGLRLNARQAATQAEHGGQPITVQRHARPVCPTPYRRPRRAAPAIQPVSVEMTTPPAGGFGGHALQGGRIGQILVAHGHRVVPVTQHGRQDASCRAATKRRASSGGPPAWRSPCPARHRRPTRRRTGPAANSTGAALRLPSWTKDA